MHFYTSSSLSSQRSFMVPSSCSMRQISNPDLTLNSDPSYTTTEFTPLETIVVKSPKRCKEKENLCCSNITINVLKPFWRNWAQEVKPLPWADYHLTKLRLTLACVWHRPLSLNNLNTACLSVHCNISLFCLPYVLFSKHFQPNCFVMCLLLDLS